MREGATPRVLEMLPALCLPAFGCGVSLHVCRSKDRHRSAVRDRHRK